jgi:hypothetical protein
MKAWSCDEKTSACNYSVRLQRRSVSISTCLFDRIISFYRTPQVIVISHFDLSHLYQDPRRPPPWIDQRDYLITFSTMPSKKEVLEKHFPGKTAKEVSNIVFKSFEAVFNDESGYPSHTKLQFPYEAPSHPVLPSRDEIMQAYKERSMRGLRRTRDGRALKIKGCMVKASTDSTLLQVGCLPNT